MFSSLARNGKAPNKSSEWNFKAPPRFRWLHSPGCPRYEKMWPLSSTGRCEEQIRHNHEQGFSWLRSLVGLSESIWQFFLCFSMWLFWWTTERRTQVISSYFSIFILAFTRERMKPFRESLASEQKHGFICGHFPCDSPSCRSPRKGLDCTRLCSSAPGRSVQSRNWIEGSLAPAERKALYYCKCKDRTGARLTSQWRPVYVTCGRNKKCCDQVFRWLANISSCPQWCSRGWVDHFRFIASLSLVWLLSANSIFFFLMRQLSCCWYGELMLHNMNVAVQAKKHIFSLINK